MAVGTEVVAIRYEDIVADNPISVPYPLYEGTDIQVYYGNASLLAVYNTDFTIALGDDFDTFTITPTASLLAKINALIAGDPTEENYIVVRRELDFKTDTTPAAVRYTPFTSREFDRTALRFQQLNEKLNRALLLSPKFIGAQPVLELSDIEPNAAIIVNGDGTALTSGPLVGDIANAQENAAIAVAAKNDAETARNEAEAFAASINLPVIGGASEGFMLHVNPTGTGYNLRKPVHGLDPETFSATGDAVADDTDEMNALFAASKHGEIVSLRGDYKMSSFENTKGLSFEGNGRIFTPITGGLWQRNSYAPKHCLHIGHEYVERPYAYMNLGQGASGTFTVRIFGDSTATDDYGGATPSAVVRRAFIERGIPNFGLYNQAVSGTRWDQCDAVSALTSTTALIFLKYGMNDPANGATLEARLAALYANMDAKLTEIRASTHGGLTNLAIVLVGPNSTSDTPNNRDEQWYEKVRGIYIAMARKHKCAYFDTYGQFQDSRGMAGIILDNPYGDGRGIHPTAQFNSRIWGKIMDEFFPRGAVALYKTNLFTNEGAISNALSAATAPSAFARGVSMNRAVPGGDWPLDGFVKTSKNPDGGVLQELWNHGSVTRVMQRTANLGSDSWNGWSGASVALTLQNGWVNQGAPWRTPIATRTAEGLVVVEGLINGGTTTAGTTLTTLPSGYRPTAAGLYRVATNGGDCTLSVNADGTIKAHTAADGTFTSINGLTFLAA